MAKPTMLKSRPAVIISNDGANKAAAGNRWGVVTVVPVTSNLSAVFPFQVLLPAADTGLKVDAKAQAEQVRSVGVERLKRKLGYVPAELMTRIDDAVRLHLGL